MASTCVVSLGCDGPRSWFVVLDSVTPRRPLASDAVDRIMFLSGEVASVIFHQDLQPQGAAGMDRPGDRGTKKEPFAGWPVLKDLEEHGRTPELEERIRVRFLVARVVRGVVEDQLVSDQDSVRHQVQGIRREMDRHPEGDREREAWTRALDALEGRNPGELLSAALEWGRAVEAQGHLDSAQEIFSLAFEMARAAGEPDSAADAARLRGKVHRTRAEWDLALAWYGVARTVSEVTGHRDKLAVVLDGLANVYRDRGNLPRARETLAQVLEIGRETRDRYTMAIGHHDLMTVLKLGGDLAGAIEAGWLAFQSYDSGDGKLRALFDLAGVLRESGELSAAQDAYLVVAEKIQGLEAQVLAVDALAYVAALMGDRVRYRAARARLERLGWKTVSPVYRGQVLYYQGLSHRALGEESEAVSRLRQALAFAEEHGLNKLVFDVEAALGDGSTPSMAPATAPSWEGRVPEEVLGVRRGLRELRTAPAGVE
jgi:tetratricopeptide (TPR) repeat protein